MSYSYLCKRLTVLICISLSLNTFSQVLRPISKFQLSDSLGCAPLTVRFTNTSQQASKFKWDFGNGTTSTAQHPTITYSQGGVFNVKLIAEDSSGNSDTMIWQKAVRVNKLPDVDFTYTIENNCLAGNKVAFSNNSSGNYKFIWDFGDGNSSTALNPNHRYKDSGKYTSRLIATDSIGCTNFKQSKLPIHILKGPSSLFTIDTTKSCDIKHTFKYTNLSSASTEWKWDFGDGSNSKLEHPMHSYGDTGNYTIQLISKDSSGCSDTLVKQNYISVNNRPVANFSLDTQLGCTPLTVNFRADSITLALYNWDLGNGIKETGKNVNATYDVHGDYTIKLVVENQVGCTDSMVKKDYIHAKGNVKSSFYADSSSMCPNHSIPFRNTSENASSFSWDFGDGSNSTIEEPSHRYKALKGMKVQLIASDSLGCSDTAIKILETFDLNPDITVEQSKGCKPFTVAFEAIGKGASKWLWDFGDGDTSQLRNPSHVYTQSGLFDVSLIVESAGGCLDTISYPEFIQVFNDSISQGIADTIYGCLPMPVDFTQNQIGNKKWLWDFGNGDTSTVQAPIYTYNSPGTYTVSLSTFNSNGCPLYLDNYLTIVIDSITPKIAVRSFNCQDKTLQFIDSTKDATSWLWDFGDGTYSTLKDPVHVFPDTAIYDITLTITTKQGCLHSVYYPSMINFSKCTVKGAPFKSAGGSSGTPNIARSIDSLNLAQKCAPQIVQFSSHVDSATSWHWDFGDGDTSNKENPLHVYRSPGTYHVMLIAQTALGPDTTFWKDHILVNGPLADFKSTITMHCDSATVQFNNNSTRASSWNWRITRDRSSTLSSPVHKFPLSNLSYPIQLTVKDSMGCTSSSLSIMNFPEQSASADYSNKICINDTVYFMPKDTSSFSYIWDFGDGTIDSSLIPSHNYTSIGSYGIQLTSINKAGCKKVQLLDSIHVKGAEASFTVSDSVICARNFLDVIPYDSTADHYLWNYGNMQSSSEQTPKLFFKQAGEYHISLTTEKDGCVNSDTLPFDISIREVERDFSIRQLTNCSPFMIEVEDTSSSNIQWEWAMDTVHEKGTHKTSFSVRADTTTTVSIFMKVTAKNGCTDSLRKRFTPVTLKADFSIEDTVGCAPFTAVFSNHSSNYTSLAWDFGNGDSSSLKSTSYTYKDSGYYDISLIVSDNSGCADTLTREKAIQVSSIKADYTVSYSNSCAPMMVNFENKTHNPSSSFWSFGDGSTSKALNPFHLYYNSGKHDISLIVTNDHGCVDTLSDKNKILVPGPITKFSFDDSTLCGSEKIQFNDSSVNAVEWHWSFGDGNTSRLQNPTHSYKTEGNYKVHLSTKDSSGCTSTFSPETAIMMRKAPVASFSVNDTIGCTPFELITQNQSLNATTWLWELGDGQQSTDTSITHNFIKSDTSSIAIYVENEIGCKDSMINTVIAIETPTVKIDSIAPICSNEVPFTLSASKFGGKWQGKGITDSLTGLFDPSLAGYGISHISYKLEGACPNTDTTLISIKKAPKAEFNANKNEACEMLKVYFKADTVQHGQPFYQWKYNDTYLGTGQKVEKVFGPGTYTIDLKVSLDNGCTDSISKADYIRVFDSVPSRAVMKRVSVKNNSSVLVEWYNTNDYAFNYYVLYRKAASDDTYKEVCKIYTQNQTGFIDKGLNTLNTTYCYKLSIVDKCEQALDLDEINEHCTINISSQKIDIDKVEVNWNAYIGCNVQKYLVYRETEDQGAPELIATLNADQFTFLDTSSYCNANYSYRIKAVGSSGLISGSWSDTAISTLNGIANMQTSELIKATVSNNSAVSLEWTKPQYAPDRAIGYVIHRSTNNEDFSPMTFIPIGHTTYTDHGVDVMNNNYFYQIEVVNTCKNKNERSNSASSILLEADRIDDHMGRLSWSEYKEWEEGVKAYKIQRLNEFNQWETIEVVPENKRQIVIGF